MNNKTTVKEPEIVRNFVWQCDTDKKLTWRNHLGSCRQCRRASKTIDLCSIGRRKYLEALS